MRILAAEQKRIAEQVRLDLAKTAGERNRLGQFATPPALALEIARYAQRLRSQQRTVLSFLDPAVGAGAFFSAFAQVFGAFDRAAGIEIDPAFAKAAHALWGEMGLTVVQGDFTRLPPPEPKFNLILTNPPYVRHHHLGASEKERLRALVKDRMQINVSGLAGLYCYFLLLADAWLAPDGLSCWLIPSEFMDVNYGTAVKRYLTDRVTLLRIHRFHPADVQFDDALVSSAIVIFRQAPPAKDHAVEMTLGGSLENPTHRMQVGTNLLRESRKWTAFPQNGPSDAPSTTGATLADLFAIKRGLATGDNRFFIVARDQVEQLRIPSDFVRPILPSPRHLRETVIEGDLDGYPRLERQLALIDCPLPEEELRGKYPTFFTYLESGKAKGIDKGYLASRRRPWYSQERRDPAPFLCTYMGRSNRGRGPFRFIWNKSKATAANVYLLLYPKESLARCLHARPALYPRVFEALRAIETEAFLAEGRVYGGGLHKIEPAELGRLSAATIWKLLPPMKRQRELQF